MTDNEQTSRDPVTAAAERVREFLRIVPIGRPHVGEGAIANVSGIGHLTVADLRTLVDAVADDAAAATWDGWEAKVRALEVEVREARENRDALAHQVAALRAENAEQRARLQQREHQHAEDLARDATIGDSGVCRTCARAIVFETVEEPGYLPRTGWSDGSRVDALVCFKSSGYRHVPLVGRERGIWEAATAAALEAVARG